MRFYGDICRVDEEARMVWGYAATTTKAEDGQIIAIEALEAALEEYMRFANIREMHQPSAVGVAAEGSVDTKGLYIGAHVVDDAAWGKVKSGVYKGFSVKGPVTQRDALDRKIIRGLKIYEISLVDRPSDPDSVFDVWRSADQAMADEDPITNDAADAAEEDDMSRAPARKPAADAATVIDAQAPAGEQGAVERSTETPGETAPEVEPVAEAEAPAAEGGEGEGGEGASEPVAEAPPAEASDVDETVRSATEAAAEASEALANLQRAVEAPAEEAIPELPGSEVRRSLSMVNRLGYVLSELTYIIYDADFEKELEGDDSTVPAQLREALRGLGQAYKAMSAEEVAELLKTANVDLAVERGIVALALGADVLERSADVEVSPDQAGRLQTLFDAFVSRGWAPIAPEAPEVGDELTRTVAVLQADKEKLTGAVQGLEAQMKTMGDQLKRLADAVPAPSKTAGLVRSVSKTEDIGGHVEDVPENREPPSAEEVQRSLDAMDPAERADLLIRAAMARPMPITHRPNTAAGE